MLSQVCQKEIARLQVPQKSTERAFFPAFPSAWNILPSFPPWYIKYLPFLWENWESICSASCSICNNGKSSDVLPIFQQRAPLNPFPWVSNTAHVPRVGMLADGRRVELVCSIHLVFPFPQNAFPYPRKEAAPFGKYISVTCLLPELLIFGSWKEKKITNKRTQFVETVAECVHLDKTQGMTVGGKDLIPLKDSSGSYLCQEN